MKIFVTLVPIFLIIIIIFSFVIINEKNKEIEKIKNELDISNKYVVELQKKIEVKNNDSIVSKEKEIKNILENYLKEEKNKKNELISNISSKELAEELTAYRKRQNFIPSEIPVLSEVSISKHFSKDHQAVDFASSEGTSVVATAAGVVKKIKNDKYLGDLIIIDHLNQYVSLYAHLSKIFVTPRLFVDKGEIIGLVGNTGNSSNPHLHFQITYKGKNIKLEDVFPQVKELN